MRVLNRDVGGTIAAKRYELERPPGGCPRPRERFADRLLNEGAQSNPSGGRYLARPVEDFGVKLKCC